uniref:Cystatin domain-containing protein n=1 Tax=Ditylenchus dipsaci TaxID=166011 RepID=A0A915EKT4_9BILA
MAWLSPINNFKSEPKTASQGKSIEDIRGRGHPVPTVILLPNHRNTKANEQFLDASTLFAVCMSDSGMTGGWTEQDVASDTVKELAHKTVQKFNTQSNDMFYLIPVEIVSAKSQVVAGIQYELKIKVGKSSCKKNQVSADEFDPKKCEETSENDRKVITARIWKKEWENFEEITFVDDDE